IHRIDDFYGDDEREIFRVPVLGRRGFGGGVDGAGAVVAANFHAGDGEIGTDFLKIFLRGVLVKDDFFRGVSDGAAGGARFAVDADFADFLFHVVGRGIDVHVAVAGEMLEHGDRAVGDDGADQALAAAGNY